MTTQNDNARSAQQPKWISPGEIRPKGSYVEGPAWLHGPLWVALNNGQVYSGRYEWQSGRWPDRLIIVVNGQEDDLWFHADSIVALAAQSVPPHPGSITSKDVSAPVEEPEVPRA